MPPTSPLSPHHMSLPAKMAAIVGDENSVGRYLLEKVGHTALIAWAIVALLHWPLMPAALAAVAVYLVVGKILWSVAHGWRLTVAAMKDIAFDTWVSCLVPLLVLVGHNITHSHYLLAAGDVASWCVLFAAGSNNRWGSPS